MQYRRVWSRVGRWASAGASATDRRLAAACVVTGRVACDGNQPSAQARLQACGRAPVLLRLTAGHTVCTWTILPAGSRGCTALNGAMRAHWPLLGSAFCASLQVGVPHATWPPRSPAHSTLTNGLVGSCSPPANKPIQPHTASPCLRNTIPSPHPLRWPYLRHDRSMSVHLSSYLVD